MMLQILDNITSNRNVWTWHHIVSYVVPSTQTEIEISIYIEKIENRTISIYLFMYNICSFIPILKMIGKTFTIFTGFKEAVENWHHLLLNLEWYFNFLDQIFLLFYLNISSKWQMLATGVNMWHGSLAKCHSFSVQLM